MAGTSPAMTPNKWLNMTATPIRNDRHPDTGPPVRFRVEPQPAPRTAAPPLPTEAQYLLARYVFETLRFRRYEWKCDALNAPSRRAALRFGFSFEGIFRDHMIIKGRSRDTAWFAMLETEWPARKAAFERWLAPENFNPDGTQKKKHGELHRS